MEPLPQNVRDFILKYIDSVEQLETLLLLQSEKSRQWTADEVAERLRIAAESAASRLESMCANGFGEEQQQAGRKVYKYNGAAQDGTIDALSVCYRQYRVRVITAIFSKPIDRVRTFADAFKIRRDT